MKIDVLRKNNFTIYKHKYLNLLDFLNSLYKEPINYNVFTNELSSETGRYEFTQTDSFEEAWNMCRFGWNEGFDKFLDEIKKIELMYILKNRIIKANKPFGGSPNVPRYLLGLPNNMHYKEKVIDKKTIDIFFNISYSYTTTSEQIINRGILTLAFINYLEKTNLYGINLHFIELSKTDNEIIYLDIPLKNKYEKLNIKKCYFPIVHPSFLRRLCFRSTEITPVKNEWNNGYGHVISFGEVKHLLDDDFKNSIYISSPDEMGINGEDINDDMEAFINVINNKYSDVLNNEQTENKEKRKVR